MSNNTTKHEYNTTQHETTQVQHETTRVQHDTTRAQHEATRVQNNLKFVLIYLYHRSCSEPGILGSKALFMLQNLEN